MLKFRGALYRPLDENMLVQTVNNEKQDAAGFLFFSGNRLLLLKRDDGFWDLPGGKIEEGEDPYSGAIRAVTEELGAVPPHTIVNEVEQLTPLGATYTTFVASVTSDYMRQFHVNLDLEHDAASWFMPEELIFIDVHPGVLTVLSKVDRP